MADEARARVVLDAGSTERSLKRIAHEILEHNKGAKDLILLGIPARGAPLARRLRDALREAGGMGVLADSLDIAMYRDDLRSNPVRVPHPTSVPGDGIDAATVVLVDGVFYLGRTIRSVLEAIADIRRPTAVQLVVPADRGHRELLIRADYVGRDLPTSRAEKARVNLAPIDEADFVAIEEA